MNNFKPGDRVRVNGGGGKYYSAGDTGTVIRKERDGDYYIQFDKPHFLDGKWHARSWKVEPLGAPFKIGDRVEHKRYGDGTVRYFHTVGNTFLVEFDGRPHLGHGGGLAPREHRTKDGHGWWCKGSDLVAADKPDVIADAPAVITGSKFKVGDIVGCAYKGDMRVGEVAADNGDGTYQVKWPSWRPECRDPAGALRPPTATPARHAIVALIENGQPMPAIRPFVHADIAAATKEAERLARKHPGQKFGAYQLVTARIGTVSVTEA